MCNTTPLQACVSENLFLLPFLANTFFLYDDDDSNTRNSSSSTQTENDECFASQSALLASCRIHSSLAEQNTQKRQTTHQLNED